jgi:hypothetical protein
MDESVQYRDPLMITIDSAEGGIVQRHRDYSEVVARLRRAVEHYVPAGAIVLVASKGDAALVTFDQRVGWHFPQDEDGKYAGFHPADSTDATLRLDALRRRGATYLSIPSTGRWWLDYYPQFNEHLQNDGVVIFDDPTTGVIFKLSPLGITTPSQLSYERIESRLPIDQLRDFLEAVLPSGCTIAVATAGDDSLLACGSVQAIHFPRGDRGEFAGDSVPPIPNLRSLASGIAQFLVVPAASFQWLEERASLRRHILASYPLVTRQVNICEVFELRRGKGKG